MSVQQAASSIRDPWMVDWSLSSRADAQGAQRHSSFVEALQSKRAPGLVGGGHAGLTPGSRPNALTKQSLAVARELIA